ncbi:MAG: NAD-dependent epimerase/dehydratase family protein [Dehalococcoidia bacterium]
MVEIPPYLARPDGDYQGARVLVLGASGFIGFNLVVALAGCGADVTAASRGVTRQPHAYPAGVRERAIDVREIDPLVGLVAGHDVVFDVAGRSGAVESNLSPLDDLRTNVVGQFNVLEACRRAAPRARIVFASSRLVYGRARYLPVDEQHPTDPTSMYGVHRLAAEKYHLLYHQMHGMATTVLRIAVPYGPCQPLDAASHGVVNLFMRTVVDGRPITLYGGGKQLRDVLHIDDLVGAMLASGRSPATIGAVMNVGGGQPVTLAELATTIVEIAGCGRVTEAPWPDDVAAVETGDFHADIGSIRALTAWVPRIPLRDGLRSSIAYYRARRQVAVAP